MQSRRKQILMHASTDDVRPSDRLSYWRDLCPTADIEPLSDRPFAAEVTMLMLPGVKIGWCRSAAAASWQRTTSKTKDGDDDFALLIPLDGRMDCSQLHREVEVSPGHGVGVLHGEPFGVRFGDNNHHLVVMVPREALARRIANLEDSATGLIHGETDALQLIKDYLSLLRENGGLANPDLQAAAANHVRDLVALAVGAPSDEADAIHTNTVGAARLATIKRDIARNPRITLNAIAKRQRVTPRYIQLLFEKEGTTFTAYLLAVRLNAAYRMLTDPHHAGWTISTIAIEAGFGDLSHFNRSFKRRFGASPSGVRERSRMS